VKVDTHSLLSKWFGESGKVVEKLFQSIEEVATDETTLVCVLVDEVDVRRREVRK
jgi:pachytene checkpoint protein 2